MVVLILDARVRRHLHVCLGSDLDDVGEEITALKGQVLNYKVHLVVGVFDTRDWDIADLLNHSGNDDSADIFPQLQSIPLVPWALREIYTHPSFPHDIPILAQEQVLDETCPLVE
jgi:hypothetical protein